MRCALRRTVLALLLGAITTVAVAWWCGWRSMPDPATIRWGTSTRSASQIPGPPVHAWRVQGIGIERVHVMISGSNEFGDHYGPLEAIWPWWLDQEDVQAADHGSGVADATMLSQGWPLAALSCDVSNYNTTEDGILLAREPVANNYMSIEHVLAFRPIWRGFVLDAALYAVGWFGLLFMPGLILRAHRRRQNRCVACGYDLRGCAESRCPECGAIQKHREALPTEAPRG